MQLLFCISNNYLLATPVQNFVFPFLFFFFFKSTLAYSCTYFTLKINFGLFFHLSMLSFTVEVPDLFLYQGTVGRYQPLLRTPMSVEHYIFEIKHLLFC